jgi:CO/xanthine dehydrogenase FAD-binding subunit
VVFTRPFRVEQAESFADASHLLRRYGEDATVISGGQSLLPLINLGLALPEVVIDISVDSKQDGNLRSVGGADGYVVVGALVTHAQLAADPVGRRQPLLGAAAALIGNARVRSRGTLGGSLAHSDPAAELPLVMIALGADYEVSNGIATRSVRADEFHLAFLTTSLEPDELIVSARVPTLGPGWGWGFQEFSRRECDFALASAAVLVRTAVGVIVESRVAIGGVSGRPQRLADIEVELSGATPEEAAGRVGIIRGVEPIADGRADPGYRAHLARVLVTRAIEEACRRSAVAV